MKKKKVIISGINGQDGAYLAQYLLSKKKYQVYGFIRRSSSYKLTRLDYLGITDKIKFYNVELTEHKRIQDIIKKIKPDYIYNLAAQSFVQYSFENPDYTFEVNLNAVLNMLEVITKENLSTRFYQASTSEMFGNNGDKFISETSGFRPASPYAISKLAAHHLIRNYRNSYNKFFCSGILFNHESFLRGIEFVTKKIINGLAKIKFSNSGPVRLGNLYSKRDWGYAPDYVKSMVKILEYKKPDDYVVATGQAHTIKQFITEACKYFNFKPTFTGSGINEKCVDKLSGKKLAIIDKSYFRKEELHYLRGDTKKIKKNLKWKANIKFKKLVELMAKEEINSFIK